MELLLPNKLQIDMFMRKQNELHPIYGVIWDKTNNPDLTRIKDSKGFKANIGIDGAIVTNDFDVSDIFGEIKDWTDTYGNEFSNIPKSYIRKVDTPTMCALMISKTRYPQFYRPHCFWDFTNKKELPHISVGKYPASLGSGNKLESKSGKFPLVNTNIVNFRTYAENNNTEEIKGYHQLDIHTIDLLQTMFTIEFATLNSQSVVAGYTNGRYHEADVVLITEAETNRIVLTNALSDNYKVGQNISLGTTRGSASVFANRTITDIVKDSPETGQASIYFDGGTVTVTAGNTLWNCGAKSGFSSGLMADVASVRSVSDGKFSFVYRGIESLFGNVYQWVDGVNIFEAEGVHKAWVTENCEDYESNLFTAPYKELSYVNSPTDGYVLELGFDSLHPYAQFPTKVGVVANSAFKDYYYRNTGARVARFGGSWDAADYAGLWCWSLLGAASSTAVHRGGRLLKKPL